MFGPCPRGRMVEGRATLESAWGRAAGPLGERFPVSAPASFTRSVAIAGADLPEAARWLLVTDSP